MQSIAVLITTTEKNKGSFEQLVGSLCKQTHKPKRLIVVYDGVLRPQKESFDECPLSITWIDNQNHASLTSLQNKAIHLVKEDFLLQLNDDLILESNFIEELVYSMKEATIGTTCGKLLRMDKQTIDTTGQLLGKSRKPVERGYDQKNTGQFDVPGFIFGACGAAVLYRMEMLKDIAITQGEYFDNSYNMFYEDLDLSWRAQNFNWKAFYNPKAIAYHRRGATAKEKKPGFQFLKAYNFAWLKTSLKSDLVKNRYMTIIKNDSILSYLLNLPYILWQDAIIFFYCMIFEPKVIIDTFKNIPLILRSFKKSAILKKKIKLKKKTR